MRFEKSKIEFVGADALIGPYRTASSPKGFTFWICKSCGRTESSAPTRWKLNNKKLLQGESALDFTFMIGKYDEKRLTQQLAQALAATKAAEAGADPEKRAAGQRRSRCPLFSQKKRAEAEIDCKRFPFPVALFAGSV